MSNALKIKEIKTRAWNNFSLGWNCPECVVEAVLTHIDTGLPKDILKMSTGFGAGIGLFGDTCGALVGAVMAVSTIHGRTSLPEGEGKEILKKSKKLLYGKPGLYRLFNQVPNRFNEKYNHTLCRELTKKWQKNWLQREHALFCREVIIYSAEIAADLILSDKDKIASKPFGVNVEGLKD